MKIKERVFIIPDSHVPYQHPVAFSLMFKAIAAFKPTVLIILGDFIDNYSISAHSKSPARKTLLASEVHDAAHQLSLISKAVGKKCKKVFICGNHEDRLPRYIERVAPELFGLVRIDALLGLDNSEWKVIPYKKSFRLGHVSYTHDLGKSGRYAGMQAADTYGSNAVIGHTHQASIVYTGNAQGKRFVGLSCGWLGDPDLIDYMHVDKARALWTHCIGTGYMLDDGVTHLQIHPMIDGAMILEGKIIT